MWMKESEICLQVSRSSGLELFRFRWENEDMKVKMSGYRWWWEQSLKDQLKYWSSLAIACCQHGHNWNIAYMTLISMMKRKVVYQSTTQGVTERNPNTQTWGIMTARLNLWFYTVCISKGEEILHSADFTQCVFQNMKSRSHSHSCQGSLCVKSESVGVT